jgi:general secretion pathway protein N
VIRSGLLLVTMILAGLLVIQWWQWPPPLPPLDGEPPDTAAGNGPGDPASGPLDQLALPDSKEAFASVIERPLFRPQRKPPDPQSAEPAPEAAAAEETSLEGSDLTAVLLSPGITMAWIRDPSAPDLKRLRLGDEHAGWSVKGILADRVVLERQGETNELLLRDFQQPQAPSPAVPVPAVPNPAARQSPAAQRPPRPSQRVPQNAAAPGGGQRDVPPRAPQPRPNVPRPSPQRPQ